MKRKGKRKMWILIVTLFLLLIVGGGGLAVLLTEGERREGRTLPIANIRFSDLRDGRYVGEYEGGMYKWRSNKVEVTVESGRVTAIKILEHKEARPVKFTEELMGRVLSAQSLQVDTISGATITSKAYLKGVENALLKALN